MNTPLFLAGARRAFQAGLVALVCSVSHAQVSLTSSTGLRLTGLANGSVQVFDAGGTQLMLFDGYKFKLGSDTPATGAATPAIVTVDGRQAIQMTYTVTNDTSGTVAITGLFTPAGDTFHARFDVSAGSTPGTGTLKCRATPSGSTKTVCHQGLWMRDLNGGVPYETNDVNGFQYTFPSGQYALLDLPGSYLAWQDTWSSNLPLVAVASGQWRAEATWALVTNGARHPVVGAALAGGRPLALDLWTSQPYNLWDSAANPLSLQTETVNTAGATRTLALSWWARDYDGNVVGSGDASQSVAAGSAWDRTLTFPAPSRGILFVEVNAESIDPTLSLRWRLDETGAPASAADATGNSRSGVVTGNVTGGTAGEAGTAFSGFTSPTSRVYYDTGSTSSPLSGASATAALWLRNPGSAARNVILGFGKNASGSDRSAEIAVGPDDGSGHRVISLSYQDWNGGHAVYSSAPVAWEADTWYHLALVWTHGSGQNYTYALYLTPDDALSLGAPVLSGSLGSTGGPGPAQGGVFYVGGHTAGYYSSFQPAGCFGGDIDTVSLWLGQALSTDQLYQNLTSHVFRRTNLAVLPPHTFSSAGTGAAAQTLRWPFDETGAPASVADAAGNGHAGIVSGNVTGVADSQSAPAFNGFSGFTSDTSYVYYDTGATSSPLSGTSATVALWLRNPGSAARNVILGFGKNASHSDRSAEIAVGPDDGSGRRVISLSYQDWNGVASVHSSAPVTWEADTWYHLAFVWTHGSSQNYTYALYLTPENAPSLGSPVLSGTLGSTGGPGPAQGGVFYVGGHTWGYYSAFQPAGYFGGSIKKVTLWLGQALGTDALYANLAGGAGSAFGLAAAFNLPDAPTELALLRRLGVRWLRQPTYTLAQAQSIGASQAQHINSAWQSGPVDTATIDASLATAVSLQSPDCEVGNEMNLSGTATAADYVTNYLVPAKTRAQAVAPGVGIMLGGLAGWDPSYIQALHDADAWNAMDAFAIHPGRGDFTADYPGENNEVSSPNTWSFLGTLRRYNNALSTYGPKPLYVTEAYACTQPNSWWHDTWRNAAEAVLLSYALALEENVKVMYFYQLNDSVWNNVGGINPADSEYHYGLLNRDLSPKPSLLAYATIAEALDQAAFVRWMWFDDARSHGLLFHSPSRGYFAVVWNRADGYVLTANTPDYATPEPWVQQWTTQTPATLPVTGATATVWDTLGRASTLTASGGHVTLPLDGAPRLVFGLSSDAGLGATLDNAGAGVTLSGSWTASTTNGGYYGSNYIHDGNTDKGSKSVTFTPALAAAGTYAVQARWTSSTNRATNVTVTITHSGGADAVTVNQQTNGGQWVTLGAYPFAAGTAGSVTLSNTGTNGYVIADAVRFVKQ